VVQTLATEVLVVLFFGGSARAIFEPLFESVAGKKFRYEVSAPGEKDSLAVAHNASLVEVMESCMIFECQNVDTVLLMEKQMFVEERKVITKQYCS
jgi:hypothetical protein